MAYSKYRFHLEPIATILPWRNDYSTVPHNSTLRSYGSSTVQSRLVLGLFDLAWTDYLPDQLVS
jgi:hypothetical protein